MLSAVLVYSDPFIVLPIEGVDPGAPLVVTSISGLDPADVTLFLGEYARDGGYYQGRRSGKRNIVINVKLNPQYATNVEASDLRDQLIRAFLEPTLAGMEDTVNLVFYVGDPDAPDVYYTLGQVETMPMDMWTKDNTAQISIMCTDPFFHGSETVFADDPVGWLTRVIPYSGQAKAGAEFTFEVKTAVDRMTFSVQGGATTEAMTLINPAGNFTVGDEIVINTNPGMRSIKLDGVDVMGMLTGASKWPKLRHGNNTVTTYGSVLSDGKVVLKSYIYEDAMWGF